MVVGEKRILAVGEKWTLLGRGEDVLGEKSIFLVVEKRVLW